MFNLLTVIMLLLTVAAVSVIITSALCKHRAYSKGYEDGYEECKGRTTTPYTVFDNQGLVHEGLDPMTGIHIYDKKKAATNLVDVIPEFGIDIKYERNKYPDENTNQRKFHINIRSMYKLDPVVITPTGVSDGFHTFDELYHYREQYNAALINTIVALKKTVDPQSKLGIFLKDVDVIKSTKHFGGEKCYGGGWFIVMIKTPWGQISNHYKLEHWYDFDCRIANVSWKWDGHGMTEALQRLHRLSANLIQYSK